MSQKRLDRFRSSSNIRCGKTISTFSTTYVKMIKIGYLLLDLSSCQTPIVSVKFFKYLTNQYFDLAHFRRVHSCVVKKKKSYGHSFSGESTKSQWNNDFEISFK